MSSYINDIQNFLKDKLTAMGINDNNIVYIFEDEQVYNYNTLPIGIIKILDTTYDQTFTYKGIITIDGIKYKATEIAKATTLVSVGIADKGRDKVLAYRDKFIESFNKQRFSLHDNTQCVFEIDKNIFISLNEKEVDFKGIAYLMAFSYKIYNKEQVTVVSDPSLEITTVKYNN